jgi:toxin ParE1/3/4
MACKLIWSPASRDDLRDIVRFIARDNPRRAESFAYQLMAQTDVLQQQPEIGRAVPEHHDPRLREIIFRPYRIVYRFDNERNTVEIARVWHAARGTPPLPSGP